MMKRLLVTLCALALAPAASAQSARFSGTVIDPEGDPICDAVVRIESIPSYGDSSFVVEAKMSCRKGKKARYAAFMQKIERAYDITVTAQGFTAFRERLYSGLTEGELNLRFQRDYSLCPSEEDAGEPRVEPDEPCTPAAETSGSS